MGLFARQGAGGEFLAAYAAESDAADGQRIDAGTRWVQAVLVTTSPGARHLSDRPGRRRGGRPGNVIQPVPRRERRPRGLRARRPREGAAYSLTVGRGGLGYTESRADWISNGDHGAAMIIEIG